MIRGYIRFGALLFPLAAILCLPFSALADRSIATNGKSAQAHVKFKVIIAPSLSMQIGALTTDKLSDSNKSEKQVFVKASGNFTQKGTLRFSATPSRMETQNTRAGNTFSSFDHNPGLSLIHTPRDQYLLTYAPNTPILVTPENRTRHYVLCSP